MDPKMKTSRCQGYFEELLNGEVPETPIPLWEDQITEHKSLGQIGRLLNLNGGKELHEAMYELYKHIWKKNKLPDEWNKATRIQRFSQILLEGLEPIAEECIKNYQCDFRKENSTIYQITTIDLLLEKKYGTKCQVSVDGKLPEEFEVMIGLKQGDALSPLLFNIRERYKAISSE
ncbi:Hypothetical protein CINCED_3A024403 [Cinara cedri]|uniref:Reverse transcriptase domain n=1 Tax=Cinara cedri TaxID=506608 RepID=A0A5E4MN90_9HEMI|nr:Hypothetical protein CINCED_3A024403 [Cinara cedri]